MISLCPIGCFCRCGAVTKGIESHRSGVNLKPEMRQSFSLATKRNQVAKMFTCQRGVRLPTKAITSFVSCGSYFCLFSRIRGYFLVRAGE